MLLPCLSRNLYYNCVHDQGHKFSYYIMDVQFVELKKKKSIIRETYKSDLQSAYLRANQKK